MDLQKSAFLKSVKDVITFNDYLTHVSNLYGGIYADNIQCEEDIIL